MVIPVSLTVPLISGQLYHIVQKNQALFDYQSNSLVLLNPWEVADHTTHFSDLQSKLINSQFIPILF